MKYRLYALAASFLMLGVEGITDRLYLRRYLELYSRDKRQYLEDLHYSFVEYGGSNITHWSFGSPRSDGICARRICPHILLVVDRDENKQERHARLHEALSDHFLRLDVREIENTIAPSVIAAVVREYEGESVALRNAFRK